MKPKQERHPEFCFFSREVDGVWICKVMGHVCGNVDVCPDSAEHDEIIKKTLEERNNGKD